NGKAEFPDGFYNITVTAKDAAGNSGSKTQKVLLENWQRVATATGLPPQPGDPPGTTRFTVGGTNWTGNASVKIWLVDPLAPLAAGQPIPGTDLGYVQTDADGNILPEEFVVDLNGDPD